MAEVPKSLSLPALEALYGKFEWSPAGPSAITIDPAWVNANITTVHVPALYKVPIDLGGGKTAEFSGNVRWHRAGVEQLLHAWAEVAAAGLIPRILSWDGSFVPRRMRGSQSLSRHSWAIAFDINAAQNGLGVTPPAAGKAGSVRDLVPIFERHGFCWGGRWENRPDGMHFELSEMRSYAPPWTILLPGGTALPTPDVEEIDGRPFARVRPLVALLLGVSPEQAPLLWVEGTRELTIASVAVGQARLLRGSVWAPVRGIAEALGLAVEVKGRTVQIQKRGQ